jgi:hypothetical protein
MNKRVSSQLKALGAASVAALISEKLSSIKGAKERLVAPLKDVAFMGNGQFLSIAYILDAEQPVKERNRLTEYVDELSATTGVWSEFEPHVSVATIPDAYAEDRILDAFWEIAPRDLTFLAANATIV